MKEMLITEQKATLYPSFKMFFNIASEEINGLENRNFYGLLF